MGYTIELIKVSKIMNDDGSELQDYEQRIIDKFIHQLKNDYILGANTKISDTVALRIINSLLKIHPDLLQDCHNNIGYNRNRFCRMCSCDNDHRFLNKQI